eukprot:TRINITY_DN4721_c0_g1_i5.p1 TRINITY_DN4721_c0_g1~~TRINITY_DN4721_c0_g1_i5.p1  ORF type:complete len:2216 (-),score=581.88 TRINITY_DN4721_c0_g1_i5:41-5764(-)
MIFLGPPHFFFYSKRGDEIFKLIHSNLKDSPSEIMLEYTAQFIEDTPDEFLRQDFEGFSKKWTALISTVFPKKQTPPTAEESKILVSILVALAKKDPKLWVATCGNLIRSSYPAEIQQIGLLSIARMSQEHPRDTDAYNDSLYYLIGPFLEDMSSPPMLQRAAVCAWPTIRPPQASKNAKVLDNVALLTMHADNELSQNAVQSLCCSVATDDNHRSFTNVLSSLFIHLAAAESLQYTELRKLFNNLIHLLEFYAKNAPARPCEDLKGWLTLRKLAESVVLMSLAHPIDWVRALSEQLLSTFSRPEYRIFEEGAKTPPFLEDFFFRVRSGDSQESSAKLPNNSLCALPRVLVVLLTKSSDFDSCVCYAWLKLCTRNWNIYRKKEEKESQSRRGQPVVPTTIEFGTQPERDQLWSNHLHFLSLGLATVLRNANSRESLIDQEIVDNFFGEIQQLLQHSSAQVVRHTISAISHMSGGISLLLNSLSTANLMPTAISGTKRKKDESTSIYFSRSMLTMLSQMMKALDFYTLDDQRALLQSCRVYADVWVRTEKLPTLSLATRTALCSTLELYIFYSVIRPIDSNSPLAVVSSGAAQHQAINRESPVASAQQIRDRFVALRTQMEFLDPISVFKIVKQLLVVPEGMGAQHMAEVERASVRVLGASLQCTSLESEADTAKIVPFLLQILTQNSTAARDVEDALAALLSQNPSFFPKMMQHSYLARADEPLERAWARKAALLGAVTVNLSTNMNSWIEKHAITPASIIFMSLLHQVQANPRQRVLGLHLASALRASQLVNLPGRLWDSTHAHKQIYVESAIRCSSLMATHNKSLTLSLIQHAAEFCTHVSDEDRDLILQLVLPWAALVPSLSASDIETALSSMFELSLMSSSAGYTNPYVVRFWTTLIEDRSTLTKSGVVPRLLALLVSHKAGVMDDDTLTLNDAQLLASNIIFYLMRQPNSDIVMACLIQNLRNHSDEVPLDPNTFIPWYDAKQATKTFIPAEDAAFEAVVEVLAENLSLCLPHLPVILQNAFIRRFDTSACLGIVCQHLMCASGTTDAEAEQIGLLRDKFISFSAAASQSASTGSLTVSLLDTPSSTLVAGPHSAVAEILAQDPYLNDEILTLLALAPKKGFPASLRADWAGVALRWALQSEDTTMALQSMKLFAVINPVYSEQLLKILSVAVAVLLRKGSTPTLVNQILSHIVEHESQDAHQDFVFRLCVVLLHTSRVEQFLLQILTLRKMASLRNQTFLRLLKACGTLWCAHPSVPLDTAFVQVLFKGLTHASTRNETTWMCETLLLGFGEQLPPASSLLLLLLVYCTMQLCTESLDYSAVRTFAANLKNPVMTAFLALFQEKERPNAPALFVELFLTHFPSRDNFSLCVMLLCQLVHLGVASWQKPILEILLLLVKKTKHLGQADVFEEAAHMYVLHCNTPGSHHTDLVFSIMSAVMRSLPQALPEHTFYAKLNELGTAGVTVREGFFPGASTEDMQSNAKTSLQLMQAHILRLSTTTNLLSLEESAFVEKKPDAALVQSSPMVQTRQRAMTKVIQKKSTELHRAAFFGQEKVVRQLIKSGMDPLALNERGDTPLHLATAQRKAKIVAILVEADPGASLIANDSGLRPVDLARINKDTKLTAFLEKLIVMSEKQKQEARQQKRQREQSIHLSSQQQLLQHLSAATLPIDKSAVNPVVLQQMVELGFAREFVLDSLDQRSAPDEKQRACLDKYDELSARREETLAQVMKRPIEAQPEPAVASSSSQKPGGISLSAGLAALPSAISSSASSRRLNSETSSLYATRATTAVRELEDAYHYQTPPPSRPPPAVPAALAGLAGASSATLFGSPAATRATGAAAPTPAAAAASPSRDRNVSQSFSLRPTDSPPLDKDEEAEWEAAFRAVTSTDFATVDTGALVFE